MYTHGMKPKLIRRNIAIWTDDYAKMEAYTKRQRISIAGLVRMAVNKYLREDEANG